MAILPVDPLKADALNKALAAPTREAYAVLTFDWDRNNTFGSAYADMSEVATEILVDRSYSAALPEGLNAITGFASGELRATLGGARPQDNGAPITLLFDPYAGASPLATYEILGTPVNLVWRVRTALGDVDTQGFRGFVRTFRINRAAGTVDLICADNLDISGADVQLPRWAAATMSPLSTSWRALPFANNTEASALPINSRWAIEETLRQAGRSYTRMPRSDALFYATMRGSGLPNIGTISDAYQLGTSPVAGTGMPGGKWTAPDGTKIQIYNDSVSPKQLCGVPKQLDARYSAKPLNPVGIQPALTVPENGSGGTPVDIGTSFLWYPTHPVGGPSTITTFRSHFFIEDYRAGEQPFGDWVQPVEDPEYNSGRCEIRIQDDRKIFVEVRENTAVGFARVWSWSMTLPSFPPEPLEIYIKFRFTTNSITAELRLDGVLQTLTASGSNPSGVGYRYRPVVESDWWKNGGQPRRFRTNAVWLYMFSFANDGTVPPPAGIDWYGGYHSTSDVEWFGGYNGVTYQSRPKIGTLPNGKPTFEYHGGSIAQYIPPGPQGLLYNTPRAENRDGWNLLAEIVAAEQGLLWTDEFGSLHIANAEYHQTPTVAVADHILSDEQVLDLIINPSDDNRRNRVITPITFKGSYLGYIWVQPGARDLYVPSGTLRADNRIEMPSNAVMYNTRRQVDPIDPPVDASTESVFTSHISAVDYADVNTAPDNWGSDLYPVPGDPLSLRFDYWALGSDSAYVGSYKGANQPNFRVAGVLDGDEVTFSSVVSDAASVANIGRRSVTLPQNPWMQSKHVAAATGAKLLGGLVNPAPLVENLVVPADPRRQIFDTVEIRNETGFSGKIYAQILSKVTRYSGGEFTDTLTLRILNNPGTAIWNAGLWDTDSWAA